VVSAIPFAAQLALGRDLLTRGRSGPVGWATAVAAVANVLLAVAGVHLLGLVGAAAATLAAYGLLHTMLRRAVRDEVRPEPLPAGLLAMLAGTAVAALGSALIPDGPVVLVVRGVVVAGTVVWFLRELLRFRGHDLGSLHRRSRRA
jgi:O-antigen/teichoic acid export membrane protein